jgi:glycosyltransferase involved in cell wall biosynthesis
VTSVSSRPSSSPPLIAHVVYRFDVGGLENGVVNLINRLPASRWRHAVIALTQVAPAMRARVARPDVAYVSLDKGPGHLVPLYPRLVRLFGEMKPAIVHTRNLAALEAVVPARLARVPAVVHGEHGRDADDIDGRNRRNLWTRRLFSPFVSRYVALSAELQRYLTDRVGVAPARITQIINGVDTALFSPRAGRAVDVDSSPSRVGSGASTDPVTNRSRERSPIDGCPFTDPSHFIVGTVGRLDTVKDQTNLARAFVSALRRHPGARERLRLAIVGDGPLRDEVLRVLAEADATPHAWLAGERHDVADVMRGLDCFVLPSLAEGISNTLLEAMASGLPVIATRVGGNAELMEEGLTGRLVPRADPEALATEILHYLDDPQLARRHGGAGRSLVEKRFSLDLMVRKYDELYSGVLGSALPAANAVAQLH